MGNLNLEEGTTLKTFKFKVNGMCGTTRKIIIDAVCKSTDNYNKMSKWVLAHLDWKIGDIVNLIHPNRKSVPKYMLAANDRNWVNKPFFMAFSKKFKKQKYFTAENEVNVNGNNIYAIVTYSYRDDTDSPEIYKNVFGTDGQCLTNTHYYEYGYAKDVISNYCAKISTGKPKIKKVNVDETSDEETLKDQVVYEIVKNDFSDIDAFKEHIEYIKCREFRNESVEKRLEILYDFYAKNEDAVIDHYEKLCTEELKKFGGCERKSTSMSVRLDTKLNLKRKQCKGYELTVFFQEGKTITLDLFGRKDTIDENGNDIVDLVPYINKGGHRPLVLSVEYDNGKPVIYASLSVPVKYNNTPSAFAHSIGVDVNLKHTLISTSYPVEKLKGYANLYKEMCESKNLLNSVSKSDLKVFRDLSKYVNVCPIEHKFLMARVDVNDNKKDKECEKAIETLLADLIKKYRDCNDIENATYVENALKMRTFLKRIIYLEELYSKKQSEYMLSLNLVDKSTDCAENMDKRRFDDQYKFVNTPEGSKLMNELNLFRHKVVGCRNNIVRYVYRLFKNNGIDGISVEELTSSTFGSKNRNAFPSPKSILKYHHLEGMTAEEADNVEAYTKFKENYVLQYDENGRICNAEYSKKGELAQKMHRSWGYIMKAVHFAEVKNEFVKMSNHRNVKISYVNPAYTSQIDSKRHCIYAVKVKTKNGKTAYAIADGKRVRPKQETHINGMNGDTNSAINIDYITSNEDWRKVMLKKTEMKYGEPQYVPVKKGQHFVISSLKKCDAIVLLDENEGSLK